MKHIFILSDGSGGSAQRIAEATLTQFPKKDFEIDIRPLIRSKRKALKAIKEAAKAKAFIVQTVVRKDLREYIKENARLHKIKTIELMGPLLKELSSFFKTSPCEKPGLYYELNKDYFKRIDAVDFALRHDDGQRTHELQKAEIILVGVSRTFKTPLSIYLAHKGWLVGNVPIVLNLPSPDILSEIPPEKIFALTTDVYRLAMVRQTRYKYLKRSSKDYINPNVIRDELKYAQKFFRQHPGWTLIKVTDKPVEEIASEILSILRKEEYLNQYKS